MGRRAQESGTGALTEGLLRVHGGFGGARRAGRRDKQGDVVRVAGARAQRVVLRDGTLASLRPADGNGRRPRPGHAHRENSSS